MNAKGFSLLELITALAIAGILFTTSHLSVKGFKSARLKSESTDLVRYIETLSLISAKYNSDIEIVFSENQAIAQVPECLNCPAFSPQILGREIQFTETKFGNFGRSPNKLILWKSGSISPGHVTLQNLSNNQCTITISQNGSKTLTCDS